MCMNMLNVKDFVGMCNDVTSITSRSIIQNKKLPFNTFQRNRTSVSMFLRIQLTLKGHCEHLQILKNGGLTDIKYMPYLYKSIVYDFITGKKMDIFE